MLGWRPYIIEEPIWDGYCSCHCTPTLWYRVSTQAAPVGAKLKFQPREFPVYAMPSAPRSSFPPGLILTFLQKYPSISPLHQPPFPFPTTRVSIQQQENMRGEFSGDGSPIWYLQTKISCFLRKWEDNQIMTNGLTWRVLKPSWLIIISCVLQWSLGILNAGWTTI